jgi:DDE superfamily endonuclease
MAARATSIIQPMEQLIIPAMKLKCKKRLLQECLASKLEILEKSKKVNVIMITSTIKKSWTPIQILKEKDCRSNDDNAIDLKQNQSLLNTSARRLRIDEFSFEETLQWILNKTNENHPLYSDQEIAEIVSTKYDVQLKQIAHSYTDCNIIILQDGTLQVLPRESVSHSSLALSKLDDVIELVKSSPQNEFSLMKALRDARLLLLQSILKE